MVKGTLGRSAAQRKGDQQSADGWASCRSRAREAPTTEAVEPLLPAGPIPALPPRTRPPWLSGFGVPAAAHGATRGVWAGSPGPLYPRCRGMSRRAHGG